MNPGTNIKSGQVILAELNFVDKNESKKRPALVLFEEKSNLIVSGITSNKSMDGIPFTKEEGAIKNSVIKLNYIFTISKNSISRYLCELNNNKKKLVYKELDRRIKNLIE